MKYLVDCTISIKLKSLIHVIPQKNLDKFFIQMNISVEKKSFC